MHTLGSLWCIKVQLQGLAESLLGVEFSGKTRQGYRVFLHKTAKRAPLVYGLIGFPQACSLARERRRGRLGSKRDVTAGGREPETSGAQVGPGGAREQTRHLGSGLKGGPECLDHTQRPKCLEGTVGHPSAKVIETAWDPPPDPCRTPASIPSRTRDTGLQVPDCSSPAPESRQADHGAVTHHLGL